MKTRLPVSVIIPLYNKKNTIERAIASVFKQENIQFEVIVVDDGSTDGSHLVLEGLSDKIRYFKQINSGPSAARNKGVKESKFPVVAFLDADDEFLPHCLEQHISYREKNLDTKLTLAAFSIFRDDIQQRTEILSDRCHNLSTIDCAHYTKGFEVGYTHNISSGSICVDKDLFEKVGGFDEKLRCWEISDILFKLSLITQSVGIINDVCTIIREDTVNGQFASTCRNTAYMYLYAKNVLEKIHEVPSEYMEVYLRIIRDISYNLLISDETQKYKELMSGVRVLLHINNLDKFVILSFMPEFILKLLLKIRKYRKLHENTV